MKSVYTVYDVVVKNCIQNLSTIRGCFIQDYPPHKHLLNFMPNQVQLIIYLLYLIKFWHVWFNWSQYLMECTQLQMFCHQYLPKNKNKRETSNSHWFSSMRMRIRRTHYNDQNNKTWKIMVKNDI